MRRVVARVAESLKIVKLAVVTSFFSSEVEHLLCTSEPAVGQWFNSTMEQTRLFSSGVEQLFYSQRVGGSIPSKDTLIWYCSSVVERGAVNSKALGSNPSRTAAFIVQW